MTQVSVKTQEKTGSAKYKKVTLALKSEQAKGASTWLYSSMPRLHGSNWMLAFTKVSYSSNTPLQIIFSSAVL